MAEYIDREAVIDELDEWKELYRDSGAACDVLVLAKRAVRKIPVADVRPIRYGKWEKHGWSIRCSECGYDMPFATRNFCPNCGADCRGDKDGE